MKKLFKNQSPVRIIVIAFFLAIIIGSGLLMLPISVQDGVSLKYIDALYTSVSAVCVTGLVPLDVGSTFSVFGYIVIAILIQIGGLGVTTVGAGIVLMVGKNMSLKGLNVVKEASNLNSRKELYLFLRYIFITTISFELLGAILSFCVFIHDMNFSQALGVSIFHAISSFNNAGFDIFGGLEGFAPGSSLIYYQKNIPINLITAFLIIFGGLGFLVIKEMFTTRFKWKKFSMHTKVVLTMTLTLIVSGTLLIKLTEQDISWLGAFFTSVSCRTAGFATYDLSTFKSSTLLLMIVYMVIGASPGSTGGGIKTTTFFALFLGIKSSATNKSEKAFHYSMPKDAYKKASVITLLGISVILVSTIFIMAFETQLGTRDALFEMASAFGTVGLSTGVTSTLGVWSKIASCIVMFIGRLGPLTIASFWYFSRGDRFSYPEGNISIG